MSVRAASALEAVAERLVAEHADRARRHAHEPRDRVDQRGLAGAVRAEQAEERAVRDRQVERVERQRAVVVALRERPDLERRRASSLA